MISAWIVVLSIMGCAALAPHSNAQVPSESVAVLLPVDEASQDRSFLRFRDELLQSLRRRDVSGVKQRLHERLTGRSLDQSLLLGPSRKSPSQPEDAVWEELEKILTLGGTFVTSEQKLYGRGLGLGDREFCAPYVYSAFPVTIPRGLGAAVVGVLLQSHVAVRAGPSEDAKLVTTRSHEIVRYQTRHPNGPTAPGWTSITTLDGIFGYVKSDTVRSVLDYHACFAVFGEQWLMTEFVRGNYP
jgi:hypothetical protein